MNSPSEPSKTAVGTPLPDLERIVKALGHTTRWKMLKDLCAGEPRTIDEMAKVAGTSYDNAFKHLAVMRNAGLIVQKHGRLAKFGRSHLCCAKHYGQKPRGEN